LKTRQEGTKLAEGVANLVLEGDEVHRLLSIMVMIVIGIRWVLYGIRYGVRSTSVTCGAELYIWGELSQKL